MSNGRLWKSDLLCTAFNVSQLPQSDAPEIAFIGRSNVGKSTLINLLLGKRIAKVSSKPGKTRSVNFYRVEAEEEIVFSLVDLPGYGYAARSRDERVGWWRLVNSYFNDRNIFFAAHLIDFRHGVLENDRELIDWLDGMDMPRVAVFTKGDKISKGRRQGLYNKYMSDGLVSILPPRIASQDDLETADKLRGDIIEIIESIKKLGC
ncbi:putative GTP-binding protein EngB [Synergistales bacterium]|nr:putative GTP-binding protein EngB [Synergistales bacterium]